MTIWPNERLTNENDSDLLGDLLNLLLPEGHEFYLPEPYRLPGSPFDPAKVVSHLDVLAAATETTPLTKLGPSQSPDLPLSSATARTFGPDRITSGAWGVRSRKHNPTEQVPPRHLTASEAALSAQSSVTGSLSPDVSRIARTASNAQPGLDSPCRAALDSSQSFGATIRYCPGFLTEVDNLYRALEEYEVERFDQNWLQLGRATARLVQKTRIVPLAAESNVHSSETPFARPLPARKRLSSLQFATVCGSLFSFASEGRGIKRESLAGVLRVVGLSCLALPLSALQGGIDFSQRHCRRVGALALSEICWFDADAVMATLPLFFMPSADDGALLTSIADRANLAVLSSNAAESRQAHDAPGTLGLSECGGRNADSIRLFRERVNHWRDAGTLQVCFESFCVSLARCEAWTPLLKVMGSTEIGQRLIQPALMNLSDECGELILGKWNNLQSASFGAANYEAFKDLRIPLAAVVSLLDALIKSCSEHDSDAFLDDETSLRPRNCLRNEAGNACLLDLIVSLLAIMFCRPFAEEVLIDRYWHHERLVLPRPPHSFRHDQLQQYICRVFDEGETPVYEELSATIGACACDRSSAQDLTTCSRQSTPTLLPESAKRLDMEKVGEREPRFDATSELKGTVEAFSERIVCDFIFKGDPVFGQRYSEILSCCMGESGHVVSMPPEASKQEATQRGDASMSREWLMAAQRQWRANGTAQGSLLASEPFSPAATEAILELWASLGQSTTAVQKYYQLLELFCRQVENFFTIDRQPVLLELFDLSDDSQGRTSVLAAAIKTIAETTGCTLTRMEVYLLRTLEAFERIHGLASELPGLGGLRKKFQTTLSLSRSCIKFFLRPMIATLSFPPSAEVCSPTQAPPQENHPLVYPTILPVHISKYLPGWFATRAAMASRRTSSRAYLSWRAASLELFACSTAALAEAGRHAVPMIAPHLDDQLLFHFLELYVHTCNPRALHLLARWLQTNQHVSQVEGLDVLLERAESSRFIRFTDSVAQVVSLTCPGNLNLADKVLQAYLTMGCYQAAAMYLNTAAPGSALEKLLKPKWQPRLESLTCRGRPPSSSRSTPSTAPDSERSDAESPARRLSAAGRTECISSMLCEVLSKRKKTEDIFPVLEALRGTCVSTKSVETDPNLNNALTLALEMASPTAGWTLLKLLVDKPFSYTVDEHMVGCLTRNANLPDEVLDSVVRAAVRGRNHHSEHAILSGVLEMMFRARSVRRAGLLLEHYLEECDGGCPPTAEIAACCFVALGRLGGEHWAGLAADLWDSLSARNAICDSHIVLTAALEAFMSFNMIDRAVTAFRLHIGLHRQGRHPHTSELEACPSIRDCDVSGLLRACTQRRRIAEAMAIYEDLRDAGHKLNDIIYNNLMHTCVISGDLESAIKILDDMSKHVNPDVITYSTIIKGLCDKGSMEMALRLFNELPAKGIAPDIVTYNTLLEGFAKSEDLKNVESLFQELLQKSDAGIKPTCYTLAILIKFFGKQKMIDRVLSLLQTLPKRFNIELDAFVYTAAIAACTWNGKVEKALPFLLDMRRKFEASSRPYGTMVAGCIKQGSWVTLRAVLECATEDRILLSRRDCASLYEVLQTFEEHTLSPKWIKGGFDASKSRRCPRNTAVAAPDMLRRFLASQPNEETKPHKPRRRH